MEESKELQGLYKVLRTAIYLSIFLEFFEYAVTPDMIGNELLIDMQKRIGKWIIYQQNNLPFSKLTTLLLVIVTCIGTISKKQLDFDVKKQVIWPLAIGLTLLVISVLLFYIKADFVLYWFDVNVWMYMVATPIFL